MLDPFVVNNLEKCFCIGLREAKKEEWFMDDGKWHCMTRFNRNIMIYGPRRSYFPFHCHVGPDWPMILLVYVLVIVINGVVLWAIHDLGYPVIIIGGIGCLIVLASYTTTACTDPGMIFEEDYSKPNTSSINSDSENVSRDIESNDGSTTIKKTFSGLPIIPPTSTIECGQCNIQRPHSSHHCYYCKTCVDHLDHHCPWCGKCIGKKNLLPFYIFLSSLSLQFYFLLASSIYYAIAVYVSQVPRGPGF